MVPLPGCCTPTALLFSALRWFRRYLSGEDFAGLSAKAGEALGALSVSDKGVCVFVEKGGTWKFVDMTESSFVNRELHVETLGLVVGGLAGALEEAFEDEVVDTEAGAGYLWRLPAELLSPPSGALFEVVVVGVDLMSFLRFGVALNAYAGAGAVAVPL